MQQIILTKGIPASGKSTWAKEQLKNKRTKRINKDLLREMLDNSSFSSSNERFMVDIRNHVVRECIKKDLDVILDDTNFKKSNFNQICAIAETFNKPIHVFEKYFPIDVEEAIQRDLTRPKPVGEKVIRQFHNTYILNKQVVENSKVFLPKEKAVSQSCHNLPKAIICDLDGTLALLENRNPYDTKNCGSDRINLPVYLIIDLMQKRNNTHIIFVSGREDKYRPETDKWLYGHFTYLTKDTLIEPEDELEFNVMPYELHMRPTGDMRKDYIVKREIYDKHIRDHYNVLFVLDDRPSVCRMWRHDLGLTVFQLDDREF